MIRCRLVVAFGPAAPHQSLETADVYAAHSLQYPGRDRQQSPVTALYLIVIDTRILTLKLIQNV